MNSIGGLLMVNWTNLHTILCILTKLLINYVIFCIQ